MTPTDSVARTVDPTVPLLALKGMCKSFHGVTALKDVDLSIQPGEIVSLIGQNGAGKSTLVSIIGGIHAHDAGTIALAGNAVQKLSPAIAEELGIGLVHQEPTLVPNMTVAANVFLKRERLKFGALLDRRAMHDQTAAVLASLGFALDPARLVEDLRLVEREVVEIAKAMLLKPRILILDEVTAPLNVGEVDHLFEIVRELKASGMAIIFISHRLNEITRLSDRIVVLRDGRNAGELLAEQRPAEKDIIALMLGPSRFEAVSGPTQAADQAPVRNKLAVRNFSSGASFDKVDLEVSGGEIVGLAGLKGSGITELMKAMYGCWPLDGGRMLVNGSPVQIRDPAQAIRHGIGMITNDRQKEGLALVRDVEENITVSTLSRLSNAFGFFRRAALRQTAGELVRQLEVKISSLDQEVVSLSGGNQQKVVVAKWLLRDLDFFLIDEPTRGVDVKAQSEIHRLLLQLKQQGKGVVVSSPELGELLRICDRILVVTGGRVQGEVRRGSPDFNEADLLAALHAGKPMPEVAAVPG